MPAVTTRNGAPRTGLVNGVVVGIVHDNNDPAQIGRVRVSFPTLVDPDGAAIISGWARVSSPMAGQGRGWICIPEVGDEVLVCFMHGDINSAVVLGSLYNGVDTPPYSNQDGDNNYRVFRSRSGHQVVFDDTSGAERIALSTPNGEVSIVWDAAEQSLYVNCGKNIVIEAAEKVEFTCADFVLGSDASISLDAGTSFDVKAGSGLTANGGSSLVLTATSTKIN